MKSIVVTGGIASGKSTVIQILQKLGGKGVALYDCDAEVARLLESESIVRDIQHSLGTEAVDSAGHVNKNFLRHLVCHDPERRELLEGILHPALADACRAAQEKARDAEETYAFLIDIPLFFETKENFQADCICTVAASPLTQLERLLARNGIGTDTAQALIDAHLPTQEKIERAHVVFWNEGTVKQLEQQVQCFFDAELAADAKSMHARAVSYDMNELRMRPLNELQQLAEQVSTRGIGNRTRSELLLGLCRQFVYQGNRVSVTGVLECSKEGCMVLRDPKRSFRPAADDVGMPSELVKRYNLRPGNMVKVRLAQAPNAKTVRCGLRAGEVVEIEGTSAEDYRQPIDFERLTPLFPRTRLILENPNLKLPAMRVLDLITPIGMGQRALVVAPPRGGKTVLLKSMAKSIRANYPKAELLVLLLDERPEEVTDFEETVDAPVYASTFDEPSSRHAQLSDLVLERARRLVEQGKDVIIMLDSLTRLARGYNANQSGGRTMSGGLGSNALEKPRKFFGAARNVEEGGSLTIIATCLVDTESRMDEIIFEEFKGTGNMEIRLDRELAERRIYPAISLAQSGTRNDDRLYHPDELPRVLQLRRQLASLPGWEALEKLLQNIKRTQNNAELLLGGLHL